MPEWSFLTRHARVLICIARDPKARMRDIATTLDITERATYDAITDLVESGYVVKQRAGRRNQYRLHTRLPIRGAAASEATIGELLEQLVG